VKDSDVKYLVDTGPLVAHINASDRWHRWSRMALQSLDAPFYTTETVIAEACYVLGNTRVAAASLTKAMVNGSLFVAPIYPDGQARINELLQKYENMDFADATLVVLSEQYPRAKLVTLDRRDFSVYRRHDGNPVPCIMPDENSRAD